ncbi:Zinc finger, LIM-type [Trema orientale]|uniref:Zinc finger, LIM-type n=1 Tax=Trema orientale TaxID=63057 RepID=A0A2P5FXV5_TREOI|nr:Zinc finger, LIM-type [Trema orientale]
MSWLTKILKGSSHRTSHGHYQGRYGEDRNSVDDNSDFDKEEIECAIALSLSEEDQKGKKVVDHESESESEDDEHLCKIQPEEDEESVKVQSDEDEEPAKVQADKDELLSSVQLEEDEQLARAIQESLSIDSPPRYDNGSMFQPYPFLFPSGYRICAGCKAEIGHGRFLSCMDAVWHPECFRCHACNLPITDYEFSMSGNRPYHKSCYKEQNHPRCDVCNNFIPTNSAGLIEYRAHPFWLQKYCPSHERDGTPRCCSCERMEVS